MLLENADKISKCIRLIRNEIKAYNKYPMRSYAAYGKWFTASNLVFEIGNLIRFHFDGNNMFNPSIMLPYYKNDEELYRYYSFFIEGIIYSFEALPKLVKENIERFVDSGLITLTDRGYKCNYRIIEYDGLFFITDMYSYNEDMVWMSLDSINTASCIKKTFKRECNHLRSNKRIHILDLCCGNGIIGCYTANLFSPRSIQISGLDINPRAVEQAKLNCILNHFKNNDFITASVYDHTYETPFDVIVSNPAYGSSPYEAQRLCHFGGKTGIEQVLSVLDHVKSNLRGNGSFFIMADSPVIHNTPLLFQEMEDKYQTYFRATYEVLYRYKSSVMDIAPSGTSEIPIDIRQRVFIYGGHATAGKGNIKYKVNRFYNFFNKF